MDFINLIISEELVYALGWTVVHSFWQGMGIALVMAGMMLVLQKQSPKVRYWFAYAALLVVLLLAVITFIDLYQLARLQNIQEITLLTTIQATTDAAFTSPEAATVSTLLQRFSSYFNQHMPLIVSVWLLGVTFFLLRLLGGLAYLQHLKTAHIYQVETHWEDMLEFLAKKLPVKRVVQLMESALVQVPVVVGHFKPLILMPVGAINGLTVEQVEAILAHELAHIARNDYFLNVVQSVIEALLYFNPAVWWISANIRTERENCCDDTAVQLCGNSLEYAKALVAIQEINQSAPNFAMAFGKKKHQLLNRVKRILNHPQNKSDMMEKFTTTCLILAVILGLSISAAQPENDDFYQNETSELPIFDKVMLPALDTLPKGKLNFTGRHKGQDVKTTVKDGKIEYLRIDGKEIPESEFKNYQPLVEEIIENVPPPPPPPPAPRAPRRVSTPPAPPAPPAPGKIGTPPTPPAPDGGYFYHESHEMEAAQREIEVNMAELQARHEALAHELGENWRQELEMNEKMLKIEEEKLRQMERKIREEHETVLADHKREMARHEAELKKLKIELEHMELKHKKLKTRIEQELVKDGYIKESAHYRLNLSGKTMEVNGKTLPTAVAEKYRKIFREIMGEDLCSDCQFTVGNGQNREE